jgi:hypothetical protein
MVAPDGECNRPLRPIPDPTLDIAGPGT